MDRFAPRVLRSSPREARKAPAASGAVADERTRHILELQRVAGNAAVVQLLGNKDDVLPWPHPEAAPFEFESGELEYHGGHFALAYDHYAKAYEYDPRPGLLYDMAQALRRLGGRRMEAIALYQRYLATGDTEASDKAQAYVDELTTPESVGVKDIDSLAAQALFAKGEEAFKSGDYAHAYDFYGQAYELDPRADLVFDQAQALKLLGGRLKETIALFERYLRLEGATATERAQKILDELRTPESAGIQEEDTKQAQALFAKGEAAYKSGDYAHAYDYYRQAYELDPRPALLYDQAQALRKLGGRSEEAISLYQRYLDSGETEASFNAKLFIAGLQAHGGFAEW